MKKVVIVIEGGMIAEMYKSPDLELDHIEVVDLDSVDPGQKQEKNDYLNRIAEKFEVIV